MGYYRNWDLGIEGETYTFDPALVALLLIMALYFTWESL